jgi:hypothetical protein
MTEKKIDQKYLTDELSRAYASLRSVMNSLNIIADKINLNLKLNTLLYKSKNIKIITNEIK